MRTWYQAGDEWNDYGEETVRIKGVYALSVGDDTPILTRLAQWKIVPKRAVDLGFEFRDAPASPRSSVNNCTESKPYSANGEVVIDFLNPPSRAERRRLLNRLRENAPSPVRRTAPLPCNHVKAREELKGIVFDVNRVWLTEGEVTRMMAGHAIRIGSRDYWSDATGRLRYERSPKHSPLERFNTLAQKHCNSVNV